ncbi:MAG: hypothetical protein NC124_15500 [Clostridium sp.]|nr:hypothetical protein [Clostridium sp.]
MAGISPDRTRLKTTSEQPLIQAGDSDIVIKRCLLCTHLAFHYGMQPFAIIHE